MRVKRIRLCQLALVFILSLAAMSRQGHAQTADSVFLGGRIFTADPQLPWAETIAVKDDRIIYVGDTTGANEFVGKTTNSFNLNDKLVLPGLMDAHTHPGWIALASRHLQLPFAESQESLYKAVETVVRAHPDRDVIIAIAWDNDLFDIKGPHKRDLDEIDATRPILIWDTWMHSLWVNSKALEVAGIDADTVDPVPGFSYYQRDADGNPTGYITESAASEFWAVFDRPEDIHEQVFVDFLNYLQSQGVTSLFDAGNFGVDIPFCELAVRLDRQGKMPLRYNGSYTLFLPRDFPNAVDRLKSMRKKCKSDRVTFETLKVYLDGVVENRTAHMTEDYLDAPGNRGAALLSRDQIHQLILDMEAAGLHMHFHTVGNQAIKTALDAVEDAHRSLGRAPEIRIALSHVELIDAEDTDRFAELGVIAQFTPHWHGPDDGSYAASIGDLEDNMYLTGSLVRSGAIVNFSSDSYFKSDWDEGNSSPFTGIQVGHNRQYVGENPESPTALPKEEALSREDMVIGYTRNGPYQQGLEDELGTITTGKKADFIVLNADLFEVDRYEIHKVQPDAVILDGKLAYGTL